MATDPVISWGNYWPKQNLDRKIRDLQKASALAHGLPQPKENRDLQKACEDFESLFIYFLLKTMRKSIPSSSFLGKGPGEDIYTSMFDQELAKNIAQYGGIGVSEMMIRELSGSNYIIKPLDITSPENYPPQTFSSGQESRTEEKPNQASKNDLGDISPLNGKITSHFGMRKDPFTDKAAFHAGIDLGMPSGSEIRAAYPGKVIFSGWKGGYGKQVVLQHDDSYTTCYAHNYKNLVKEGDVVEAGQVIALVGDTGRTTGPHLHFELRKSGIPIDPKKVIDLKT